jgi:hypothetical protein
MTRRKNYSAALMPREKSILVPAEVFDDHASSSTSDSESEEQNQACFVNELLDREERGDGLREVSLSELSDLDLFDRYQEGDVLNEDDMELLDDFRLRRRKDLRYRKELEMLLNHQTGGRPVDHHRLLFLTLFSRLGCCETLSEDEIATLCKLDLSESDISSTATIGWCSAASSEQMNNHKMLGLCCTKNEN